MRIGVLTTSYPRDDDDAAGAFVAGFARWLAGRGAEVEVLCADAGRPLFYRGGAPLALGRPRRWPEALGFTLALARAAARQAPGWDALVSHWLVPSALVGALVGGGRPHLAIAHGSDARLLGRLPGGAAVARMLARRSDLVYVAADLMLPGAPGRVVPMAIDVAPIAAACDAAARARARRALGLDGAVALFLGRLVRDKGCDLACAAAAGLGLTLVVAGDGPERAALAATAPANVRFVGAVHGAAKLDLLAAADLLVIPSRLDGAPTVALEGLAAGLPIVATRTGGLPELLHDGDTALLADAEIASLRAAFARVIADTALARRLAKAARAAAPAHDWSRVGPRLAGKLGAFLPDDATARPPEPTPVLAREACVRKLAL